MTNERVKVVGTFILDGMIQGKIPPGQGFEKGVREWIARQRGKGLQFEFSTDGNNFSLLPDDSPGRTASFAPEGITPYLEKAYRELLDLIPATGRMGLLSTLRSIEYREGSEIQTVHLLENPGVIKSRQRTVEAETVTPPTEPGLGSKVKLALGGMVLAAVLLYLSSFFIDWKNHLFGPIGELMADPESIPVEADAFDGFFLVEGKEYDGGARMIRVEISPGPLLEIAPLGDWPTESASRTEESLRMREMAIDSVRRKCIACLYYDKDGRLLKREEIPFDPLFDGDPPIDAILIPIPRRIPIHRLVLWPS